MNYLSLSKRLGRTIVKRNWSLCLFWVSDYVGLPSEKIASVILLKFFGSCPSNAGANASMPVLMNIRQHQKPWKMLDCLMVWNAK